MSTAAAADSTAPTDARPRVIVHAHSPHAVWMVSPLLDGLEARGYDPVLTYIDRPGMVPDLSLAGEHRVRAIAPAAPRGTLARRVGSLHSFLRELVTRNESRELATTLLDEERPAAVFLTADTSFPEAWIIEEANARGIVTVMLQTMWGFSVQNQGYFWGRLGSRAGHLVRFRTSLRNQLDRRFRLAKRIVIEAIWRTLGIRFRAALAYGGNARRFALAGDGFVPWFEQRGVPLDRIDVTGVALADYFYERSRAYDADAAATVVRDELRLPPGPIVVYATQWFVKSGLLSASEHERQTRAVAEAVLGATDATLVIKAHPEEQVEDYAYLRQYGARVAVCRDYDLLALIEACTIFLTQFSDTATIAMAWGKPIVSLNLAGTVAGDVYRQVGGTFHVDRAEDLHAAMAAVRFDADVQERLRNERERLMREYLWCDGGAIDRLVDVIDREVATLSSA